LIFGTGLGIKNESLIRVSCTLLDWKKKRIIQFSEVSLLLSDHEKTNFLDYFLELARMARRNNCNDGKTSTNFCTAFGMLLLGFTDRTLYSYSDMKLVFPIHLWSFLWCGPRQVDSTPAASFFLAVHTWYSLLAPTFVLMMHS